MRYLIGTGILVRLAHRGDPLNQVIRDAMNSIHRGGHAFVAATQNIAEFWNVCTRPAESRGGFGLGVEETARRLRLLERFINVLREPDSGYARWKGLLISHQITGKAVHDARLVAFMNAYRIRRILTLNTQDFRRYSNLEVLSPADVVARHP
jgi:predicted nucleic acid-binding protein